MMPILKLMKVLPFVVMLSACVKSINSTPTFLPAPPPKIPDELLEPCKPTPQVRQKDGHASSSDDQQTITDGRYDLAKCENKRKLAVESWPKK